jgi:hypothetical protein
MKPSISFMLIVLMVAILINGCTKNIEPFPSSATLSPSLSVPLGEGGVSLSKTLQTLGVPVVNLLEDVPPWATYGFVYVVDTIPLNLTEVYNRADSITYLMVRTNIWNQFPLGGRAQVFFLDANNAAIDQLYEDMVSVGPAEHGSHGEVVNTAFETYETSFNISRISLLSAAQKVVIYAGLEITDEGVSESNISYFDQYQLRVQVAIRVDFSMNLNY